MWYRDLIIVCMLGLCGVLWPDPAAAHEDKATAGSIKTKIGVQERVRGDFARNQNLGDFSFTPGMHDEQVLNRTRLNFFMSPVEGVDGFIEGQFYMRENHDDYARINLYQAYLDLHDIKNIPINLKIGRQELCYGSGFSLGTNDFYDGLVWDAAKMRLLVGDKLWVDGIAARFVDLNKGTSKNRPAIYGAYSRYGFNKETDLDLYFFYHHGGFRFFHSDLPDSPMWYTIGTRLAGKVMGQFDYEIEPLYQFGKIDNPEGAERDTIAAYGGHVEAGYTFTSKYNPRIFAGYAFGSGDNDTQNKYYTEFHGNVYNDNYIVGDISLIPDVSGVTVGGKRASGMHVIIGGLSFDLNEKINLNIDYHYFLADKTPSDISKTIGGELNAIATFNISDNLNLILSANRFFTGNFFEDATGSKKDIDYFYAATQIQF